MPTPSPSCLQEGGDSEMRYLPLTPDDRKEMLAAGGAASIDDLFADVPAEARLSGPIPGLPMHASELAVERHATSKLPADDLTLRAARALQQATGCPLGAHITLDKRIPAEAGMGGGSSDAASVLLALNRLWGLGLKRHELSAIGLQLGADVPFFLGGHNAWVEGVGEQITPISLPPARFLVVKPAGGASTQRIFASPLLKRDTKTATIQGFAANDSTADAGWRVSDMTALLAFGHNDMQPVAQTLCPEMGDCLDWLTGLGLQGRMSGSGTAVFAPVPPGTPLPSAPGPWTVRRCSNMDVHPLAHWHTG